MKYKIFPITLFAIVLMGQGCFSLGTEQEVQTSGAGGFFVSTDKGGAWSPISTLPEPDGAKNLNTLSVYRLFEDPNDPNALYWASREGGMFFTYDSGRTWQRPGSGPNAGFIYSVAVHPADKCVIFATNGSQVFRSDDCNRTWSEVYRISGDDRVSSVAVGQFDPYPVYLLTYNGDFLQSSDNGISWRIGRRFKTQSIDIFTDPFVDHRIFIGTQSKGMWRSTDDGETWVQIVNPFFNIAGGQEYRRFVMHPTIPDLMFYASTYGIHRSTDGAEHWQELSLLHAPGAARIFGLAVSPENPNEIYYTATINNRSTLYKSVDGGQTWISEKLPSGQIPSVLRVHRDHPEWLYVGFTIPAN
ncbi:MAG: hypothetical protein COU35_02220 [Candidatus Magasanikbacteria bacterium CG10_big_fil_rev_8_21_14_0_10_47_10]|uniref:Sortilin N-terminal domain-containing protein n=1 Tax=Candidatus Magasanikbacteria bacterium CG10_big_fil_rev_8_21_14_0_10_47_10 TaxID=1974652 RepID=A0A2H0TQQ0_9BACT|nr:MAG: hypothetical protein COU35_02220 [Candidatus Magasanikbacteria bacterium CG10_big_fil_rev_8_21_14_0_10_47_10]